MESETLCCWKQQCFALLLLQKQNDGGTYGFLSGPIDLLLILIRVTAAVVAAIDPEFAAITHQQADKRKSLVNRSSSLL